jgi:hypothetical protein
MRKALICTMGLAVVLLWATRGAAHGRAFSGVGVGAPVRSFIGVFHSRAFFHTGFGVPAHPGAFFHTGFGVPAHPGAFFHTGFEVPAHPGAFFHTGFGVPVRPGVVAPRVLVITLPIVIGPRALVTAPHVSMHVAPQTVVVLHPVRRAPPVFVTDPRARFVSPAVIVLTPQTTSGARTAKRANTSFTSLGS